MRAEIKWGLFIRTQRARPTRWDLSWIRAMVATCRALDADSLTGFEFGAGPSAEFTGAIAKEILRLPDEARGPAAELLPDKDDGSTIAVMPGSVEAPDLPEGIRTPRPAHQLTAL